uniref:P9-2 protein n=1 Tax=Mal de Rio Cuarto virus TaxID=185954 RepID=A9UL36_9REOV|nr:unknown [Mal de Rio Cuarto virus]AAY51857.1 unknown [Mal de Rio Cuarto virus]
MNPQTSVNIDTYTFHCPFELAKTQYNVVKPIMQDFSNFDEILEHPLSDSDIDEKFEKLEHDVEEIVDPVVRRNYGKCGHIILMIISFVFFGLFKVTMKMFYHLFRCVCCNPLVRGVFSILFTILLYVLIIVSLYLVYFFFGDAIYEFYNEMSTFKESINVNVTSVNEKIDSVIEKGSLFFGVVDKDTGAVHETEHLVNNGGIVNLTLIN